MKKSAVAPPLPSGFRNAALDFTILGNRVRKQAAIDEDYFTAREGGAKGE